MKSKPEEPLFIQESRKGCSESMQIAIDYIDALTAYVTEKETDEQLLMECLNIEVEAFYIERQRAEKAEARCRDANTGHLAATDPNFYEGSFLQRLDDLVHEITGDEGDDDSLTVLRRWAADQKARCSELEADARRLRKQLIERRRPEKLPPHEWGGDYPSSDSYSDGYVKGWNDCIDSKPAAIDAATAREGGEDIDC